MLFDINHAQLAISIHAPHARSDTAMRTTMMQPIHFNPRSSCEERPGRPRPHRDTQISIHAPHARSDHEKIPREQLTGQFQSTLLMRGATIVYGLLCWSVQRFQSTLLMRGATCVLDEFVFAADCISIHAPHARSDDSAFFRQSEDTQFQSTLLMRGATFVKIFCLSNTYFNPRSSCEERRAKSKKERKIGQIFQSTLLMRGATRRDTGQKNIGRHFNPRSSCEERRP